MCPRTFIDKWICFSSSWICLKGKSYNLCVRIKICLYAFVLGANICVPLYGTHVRSIFGIIFCHAMHVLCSGKNPHERDARMNCASSWRTRCVRCLREHIWQSMLCELCMFADMCAHSLHTDMLLARYLNTGSIHWNNVSNSALNFTQAWNC